MCTYLSLIYNYQNQAHLIINKLMCLTKMNCKIIKLMRLFMINLISTYSQLSLGSAKMCA